jgi:hypothetical protein
MSPHLPCLDHLLSLLVHPLDAPVRVEALWEGGDGLSHLLQDLRVDPRVLDLGDLLGALETWKRETIILPQLKVGIRFGVFELLKT